MYQGGSFSNQGSAILQQQSADIAMKTFNGRLRFRGNQVHVQLNALGLAGPALQNLLAEYLVSGERGTVTFRLTRALITNDGSLVISGYVANANTVQACHQ